jgi:ribonuclease-3
VPDDLDRLQSRLGYQFSDTGLLLQALTHRSAHRRDNNERLEFLGDALLGQIVASWLFQAFPEASEGQLTRMRASLVREKTLAELGRELGVGEFLVLGGGELKSGGFRRASILADAVEALIGAMQLDGGEQVCRRTVLDWFGQRLDKVSPDLIKDPKTRLQEWLQARRRGLPRYQVMDVRGQAPNQEFDVTCYLAEDTQETFSATGSSRRKAEQAAALAALEWLHGEEEAKQ